MIPTQFGTARGPGSMMFIAEAPADEEMIKGQPLVGPTGFMLSKILRAARLTESLEDMPAAYLPHLRGETRRLMWERRQWTFANVFNEQLPDNDVGKWCEGAVAHKQRPGIDKLKSPLALPIGGSGWLRPEFFEHIERLHADIRTAEPMLIIPLGATALWAVRGLASIDALRGSLLMSPFGKVLPTYHPAYILRQYKMFSVMVADLMRAAREAQFPEIVSPHVELWLDPTIDDLHEFAKRFIWRPDVGPLGIDIETGGGQISCVSLTPDRIHSLIVPFIDYRKPDRSYWRTEDEELHALNFLATVLESPIPKLMQSGAFDSTWLASYGLKVMNYREDTRMLHKVLYPELPASLAFMGNTYTDLHAWKYGVRHHGTEAKRDA